MKQKDWVNNDWMACVYGARRWRTSFKIETCTTYHNASFIHSFIKIVDTPWLIWFIHFHAIATYLIYQSVAHSIISKLVFFRRIKISVWRNDTIFGPKNSKNKLILLRNGVGWTSCTQNELSNGIVLISRVIKIKSRNTISNFNIFFL